MKIFNSIDDVMGSVIREENPYVKVLSKPRCEVYELVPGMALERWEAIAQVDGVIAVVSLTVTPTGKND